nr:PREDICTED: tectonic-2 isoform X1 [Lepisosteus oculatus]
MIMVPRSDGIFCFCFWLYLYAFMEDARGSVVFQPAFVFASGPTVTALLLGNTSGVSFMLRTSVPSNSTGSLPIASCAGNSSGQWQLTAETVGQNTLKVTLRLNRTLQLCGRGLNQTDCCPEALCVVEALQVTACLHSVAQDTLVVQAEIYAQIPFTGNVSDNKTVIPNQAYQPLGSCPCDLTVGSCDVRCCCDQECTPEARQLFSSRCFLGIFGGNVTPPFDQQCSVQSANNSPDWFPFLCVCSPPANSPFLGLFYQGATVSPKPRPFFQTPIFPVAVPFDSYKQGDPIFTASGEYFTIPQQSLVGQCMWSAPVAYLQNFQSSCNVLLTTCETNPALCLRAPDLSLNINNGLGGTVTISVSEEIVSDLSTFVSDPNGAGTLSATQSSLFPGSKPPGANSEPQGLCGNVTLSLDYTLFWKGNGLTNITVTHTIGTVCSNPNGTLPLTLTQRFAAVFVSGNMASQTNSGNPGYQIGRPVIAAKEETGDSGLTRTSINLWQPVGDGLCASARTTPVLFGEDSSTGCLLRLSLQDMSNCSQLRETVQDGLAALVNATYVAKKGNSNLSSLTEWVPIISVQPNTTSNATGISGTCTQVPAHLNIRIATSVAGAVAGVPQQEILAVEVRYALTTWAVRCGGGDTAPCVNSSVVQSFPVSVSVTFLAIPSEPLPPKTRFQINYTEYDCDRNDVCWPQLAFPLTRYYTGEPYSQSLAKGLILVFFFIAASVLGTPWNQIRQAWNNTTF